MWSELAPTHCRLIWRRIIMQSPSRERHPFFRAHCPTDETIEFNRVEAKHRFFLGWTLHVRLALCLARRTYLEFSRAPLLRLPVFLATPLPAGTFDLQGDSGARGLHPENTIAGFEQAIELGATAIETDLAVTRAVCSCFYTRRNSTPICCGAYMVTASCGRYCSFPLPED